MTAERINLIEALTREIERVAAMRERIRMIDPHFNAQEPLMSRALEIAHRVAARESIPDIADSVRDLQRFSI